MSISWCWPFDHLTRSYWLSDTACCLYVVHVVHVRKKLTMSNVNGIRLCLEKEQCEFAWVCDFCLMSLSPTFVSNAIVLQHVILFHKLSILGSTAFIDFNMLSMGKGGLVSCHLIHCANQRCGHELKCTLCFCIYSKKLFKVIVVQIQNNFFLYHLFCQPTGVC